MSRRKKTKKVRIDPEEYLDKKVCNCGTVRDVIDAAATIAVGNNDQCAVYDTIVPFVAFMMCINLIRRAEMKVGNDEDTSAMKAAAISTMVQEATKDMFEIVGDHIARTLEEKIASHDERPVGVALH